MILKNPQGLLCFRNMEMKIKKNAGQQFIYRLKINKYSLKMLRDLAESTLR